MSDLLGLGRYNQDLREALSFLDQPVIAGLVRVFLILYAGLAAPALPDTVLKWFNYVPFRIFILFLIVYTAQKERKPDIAILIAVGFYVSINVLAGRQMFEKFNQTKYYQQ